jgi:3-oxoacyl-[acyl-carrier-protein] synthase-3
VQTNSAFGIHSIGVYLPDEVRTNAWWSKTTVAKWQARSAAGLQAERVAAVPTSGAAATLAAMVRLAADPFKGAIERRVAPPDMRSSEMEANAARDALARAKIDRRDVELLLVHSVTPDFLNTPNACKVHRALELPERCLAMSVDGMCNAFQMQLALAQRYLAGRPGKYALLVQSTQAARMMSPDEPMSAWFGEGATAVVVGSVASDLGLLSSSHYADGSRFGGLVFGVPGRRWYEGTIEAYSEDREAAKKVILFVADRAAQSVGEALTEAKVRPKDVAFYAAHQGTVWLREVTQAHCGLRSARFVDTFARFGSLVSANLPLILAIGEREGMLSRGDTVCLFSGGNGETWSSTVMRWGRD